MKNLLILVAGMFLIFALAGSVSAECDVCGDLTGDGEVDIADITAFVDWYFNWPNPITPACPCGANVNCDGVVNVNIYDYYDTNTDLGYLLTYMFLGGAPPCDMDNNGIPNCDPCDF